MADNTNQAAQSSPPPTVGNYMLALMEAIQKDQSTMSEQQLVDAKSTMNATTFETDIYNYWKTQLQKDADAVTDASTSKGSDSDRSAKTNAAQAQFSKDNAVAQMNESQQDSLVQSTQGQAQSDATNLQMKASIAQAANSVLTTLVNLLGTIQA